MKKLKLETQRLVLRPWELYDVDDLVDGLNNIEVSKWLAFVPYPYTKEHAEFFINMAANSKDLEFAIILKSEDRVIGGVSISNISKIHGTAGGGIWLNEKYHGLGYGTEAFGKRIEFAFQELELRRLENGYFRGNEKSWQMQKKFGYKQEGIRRKKFVCMATGLAEDEYITGLLKEEWIKQ